MISDSLCYALISESREAPFPERRQAASALLEVARSERELDDIDEVLATLEQKLGDDLAPEARALVVDLGAF